MNAACAARGIGSTVTVEHCLPIYVYIYCGLAWLGLAWLGLAWLGLAWLGLARTMPLFSCSTQRGPVLRRKLPCQVTQQRRKPQWAWLGLRYYCTVGLCVKGDTVAVPLDGAVANRRALVAADDRPHPRHQHWHPTDRYGATGGVQRATCNIILRMRA